MTDRPTPFELVFGAMAEPRFPAIREALGPHDPADRDRFLLEKPVVELLQELRPDDGIGDGMDQLVGLLHHGYLFWLAGQPVVRLSVAALAALLAEPPAPRDDGPPSGGAVYIQVPERRLWAAVVEGEAHEPLDGCFLHRAGPADLRVLGVFGLHPGRDAFTVAETAGPRPGRLARLDGTPLFSPVLPGGERAGLHSLVGGEEMLAFGWRGWDWSRAGAAARGDGAH